MKKGVEYLASGEKRALDVTTALALGSMALPVAVTGAAIFARAYKLRVNELFTVARRHGRGDDMVDVLKLQTTPTDETLFARRPISQKLAPYLKQAGVDEAPQLLNVLGGAMSIVGPRPMDDRALESYHDADPILFEDWRVSYGSMKPGLCGASQILRHSKLDPNSPELIRRGMALDVTYATEATLWGDVQILARTPRDLMGAVEEAFTQAA